MLSNSIEPRIRPTLDYSLSKPPLVGWLPGGSSLVYGWGCLGPILSFYFCLCAYFRLVESVIIQQLILHFFGGKRLH